MTVSNTVEMALVIFCGTLATLRSMSVFRAALLVSVLSLAACSSEQNDPYPAHERGQNILYSAFTERPTHLVPAQS